MIRYEFSGKVVLVTGATSGIGREIAHAFARAGASVVLAARDVEAGARTCAEIAAAGGKAFFVATDVRDEASVDAAVAAAVAKHGRLDHAVNCAGVGGDMSPLETATVTAFDDVMATNARGVWLALRAEARAMIATGGGSIVNMSSIYGLSGKAAHHAYVASKHAVLGLTRSAALELATKNVRVNAICAGITRTAAMDRAEAAVPELVASLVAEHPLGRMATEAEIASAALWLSSDDAGFVTGAPLVVDGGLLAA